jgi:hypothetical protein
MKCVRTEHSLSAFDRRSIRTIYRGKAKMLVGCPKGQWQASRQQCKVGTRAHEIITPGRCRHGGRTLRS